jgi:hypothetical protein
LADLVGGELDQHRLLVSEDATIGHLLATAHGETRR